MSKSVCELPVSCNTSLSTLFSSRNYSVFDSLHGHGLHGKCPQRNTIAILQHEPRPLMPCLAAMYKCPLNCFRDNNEKNYSIFHEAFRLERLTTVGLWTAHYFIGPANLCTRSTTRIALPHLNRSIQ